MKNSKTIEVRLLKLNFNSLKDIIFLMQKPQFINNEIYHIYNRGVEKRNIFSDKKDHFRFIHNLFEFNDENPVLNTGYYFNRQTMEVELRYIEETKKKERKPRKLLVEILTFCLMPNHYHLLLRQKKEKGIVRFMQKLGTGYTNYFNKKYERVGSLLQGRFKAIHVNKEEYLDFLLYYIHFNPLDLFEPGWREEKIKNYQKAIEFLNSYRWSSHLDYIDKKNFPSVTQREFLLNTLGGEKNYQQNIEKWFEEIVKRKDIEDFGKIRLE
ncbi:hypothetical protein LCGC14_0509920 [marine sediment metagenome]|uniref:Transposase IS200-like domain-containing protein n=1 Tax=marine sediment metagenome TaxID=412755 RepID=A0A0F9S6B3_9ZZZZ